MEKENNGNKKDFIPKKIYDGYHHIKFVGILFFISLIIYLWTGGYGFNFIQNISTWNFNLEDLNKLSFLLIKKSLTAIICLLFSYYWRTKKYDVDSRIAGTSDAVAIYHGAMFVAIGFS